MHGLEEAPELTGSSCRWAGLALLGRYQVLGGNPRVIALSLRVGGPHANARGVQGVNNGDWSRPTRVSVGFTLRSGIP